MWKHFFYFNKTERIAVIALLVVIVLLIVSIHLLPLLLTPKTISPNKEELAEYLAFIESVENPQQASDKKEFVQNLPTDNELFLFDPNTADSATLAKLGLNGYQISNILKYRLKGGKFYTKADFAKIYGLNSELYEVLSPYISLSENNRNTDASSNVIVFDKQEKYPLGTLIDLNRADTIELKKIPGIGTVFSKRIVSYRNLLGGFYTVHQLKEVYGITSEMYKNLSQWFKVEDNNLRKLPVNKLTFNPLRKHPYISEKQASAILLLKEQKGKLTSIEDIAQLKEFSANDIERLSYYLSFE